jgi:hypothetical protein
MEAFLRKMCCLMPKMLKEVHYPGRDTHVCQKSHAIASSIMVGIISGVAAHDKR